MEVPSEPAESGFCKKIKLKSYPLVEKGGVVWVYMGPAEQRPPDPEWEFATVPAAQSYISKRLQECNWLQAMEGGIDSSHVSFLHSGQLNHDPLFKGAKGNQYNLGDRKPVFEVVESEGGLYIGARRNAENGNYYWRITQFVLPSFTQIAPRGGHTVHGHFWIPIDDENCWTWSYDFHPTRDLTALERQAMQDGKGIHVKYTPGTYRPLANKDNDYLMDRAAQKQNRDSETRALCRSHDRAADRAGGARPALRAHRLPLRVRHRGRGGECDSSRCAHVGRDQVPHPRRHGALSGRLLYVALHGPAGAPARRAVRRRDQAGRQLVDRLRAH